MGYGFKVRMLLGQPNVYSQQTRVMAILPPTCRPAQRSTFMVRQGVDIGNNRPRIDILPDGKVMLMSGEDWYREQDSTKSVRSCRNLKGTGNSNYPGTQQWKQKGWPRKESVCSESDVSSEISNGVCVNSKTWTQSKGKCSSLEIIIVVLLH